MSKLIGEMTNVKVFSQSNGLWIVDEHTGEETTVELKDLKHLFEFLKEHFGEGMKSAQWFNDEGKIRFRCSKCMKSDFMQLTPKQQEWYKEHIKNHKCEETK